jgi:anti-anti-sigma regulatory factor
MVPSADGQDTLVLDLSDVSFVDDSGIAFFRELVAKRVRLINGSPFVLEQLSEVAEDDAE